MQVPPISAQRPHLVPQMFVAAPGVNVCGVALLTKPTGHAEHVFGDRVAGHDTRRQEVNAGHGYLRPTTASSRDSLCPSELICSRKAVTAAVTSPWFWSAKSSSRAAS